MARALVAVFVVLFASSVMAAEAVGKVKICRADGYAYPPLNEILPDGFVAAADGVTLSIPAKSLPMLEKGQCAVVSVVLSGNHAPSMGAKWSKDVVYHDQIIHMDTNTTEDITKTTTVTAEAVDDFAPVQRGKIRLCRTPGIVGLTDGKRVAIPAGTYTGASDKNGENSRAIEIAAEGATLGAGKRDCVTLDATLLGGDGKPVRAGERLDAQWSVTGFEPRVTVVTAFK